MAAAATPSPQQRLLSLRPAPPTATACPPEMVAQAQASARLLHNTHTPPSPTVPAAARRRARAAVAGSCHAHAMETGLPNGHKAAAAAADATRQKACRSAQPPWSAAPRTWLAKCTSAPSGLHRVCWGGEAAPPPAIHRAERMRWQWVRLARGRQGVPRGRRRRRRWRWWRHRGGGRTPPPIPHPLPPPPSHLLPGTRRQEAGAATVERSGSGGIGNTWPAKCTEPGEGERPGREWGGGSGGGEAGHRAEHLPPSLARAAEGRRAAQFVPVGGPQHGGPGVFLLMQDLGGGRPWQRGRPRQRRQTRPHVRPCRRVRAHPPPPWRRSD